MWATFMEVIAFVLFICISADEAYHVYILDEKAESLSLTVHL